MKETCPYCDEEKSALKNHVRLASGGGHGPSGAYPDDFEDGTDHDPPPSSHDDAKSRESGADADGIDPEDEAGGSHSSPQNTSPAAGAVTVEMTDEEIDRGIDGAAETGRKEGFADGYETAADELGETCPECDGQLATNADGEQFTRHDGARLTLEASDAVCLSCDLVVPEQGEPIRGSEYDGTTEDTADLTDESGSSGWGGIILAGVLGLVMLVAGTITNGGRNNNGPGDGPEVF